MTRIRAVAACLAVLVVSTMLAGCGADPATVTIGLLYPKGGTQGPSGQEEQHGAELAAAWANAHGGIHGRQIRLVSTAADDGAAVPAALDRLQRGGATIVVGSHGSTVSTVAADEATRRHLLLWETGAVGLTDGGVVGGRNFIRMAPMGANLGRAAVDFVNQPLAAALAAASPAHPGPYRWAVAYVDDVYGRAVAGGALDELAATREPSAGTFPYALTGFDANALADRIAAVHPDALFVSSYIDDAVALRRALVQHHVPLVVNIGTSSSYCMPAFGRRLGPDGVGLFASDKPDAGGVRTDALSPEGRAALAWVVPRYTSMYHVAMSSHALSGFANAFALFVHVLPAAGAMTPEAVSAAALSVKLPVGSLANGGGMDIAPMGAADAGNNRAAAGVIWEWVGSGQRAVVWPPTFATHPVVALPLAS